MRARINVSLTPADRPAVWSRHTQDVYAAARSIPRASEAVVGRIIDGAYDEANTWSDLLDRYLEGWAEVDLSKIFAATAHNYRFDDPLVAVAAKDLAFFIRGPMDGPLSRGRLKFFREAPRLGLTGISFITIGEHGVIAESVAYDLNLALAVHQRRAPTEQL
jgi:hypothetical protein